MIFPPGAMKSKSAYSSFDRSGDPAALLTDSAAFRTSDDATPTLRPAVGFDNLSIAGSGATELVALAGLDDAHTNFALGLFSFPYYGNSPAGPHSTIYVSTNGFITFVAMANHNADASPLYTPGNTLFPNTAAEPYTIAPLYADLVVNKVWKKEYSDRVVIMWDAGDNYYLNPNDGRGFFNVTLYSDGIIYFYYQTMGMNLTYFNKPSPNFGSTPFVVGIQDGTKTKGVQVESGAQPSAIVHSNMAIRFKLPS